MAKLTLGTCKDSFSGKVHHLKNRYCVSWKPIRQLKHKTAPRKRAGKG